MKYLLILLSVTLIGCGQRTNPQELRAVGTATENLHVVSGHLAQNPQTAPAGSIVADQARVIDHSLSLTEEKKKELQVQPTVSAVGLATNPQAEADKSKQDAAILIKANEDSRTGFWYWLTNGSLLATAGGIALFAARLLNVPGVQLVSDPLVRWLGAKWIGPIEDKAQQAQQQVQVLSTAVQSSMAGRYALRAIDEKLTEEQRKSLLLLTGGKVSTVEDLFTWAAQAAARDAGQSTEVHEVISHIKDSMPTTGGLPTVLAALLK